MSLTGRTRFRLQRRFLRRSIVVLEVEETLHHMRPCGNGWDEWDVTRWRDARWDDLETQQSIKRPGRPMVPPNMPPGSTPPAKPTR